MIQDFLQERAALYAAGAMTAGEREQFELVLEFHHELRACVAEMSDTATALAVSTPLRTAFPLSPGVKERVLSAIAGRPQRMTPEGLVMTGSDGLVQWINPAFSAMCGYTIEELSGKKLGPILQGKETDRGTVERMRQAVHEYRSCKETILNYHKNRTPYWVEIAIVPIFDDTGQPLWLVARETELPGYAVA